MFSGKFKKILAFAVAVNLLCCFLIVQIALSDSSGGAKGAIEKAFPNVKIDSLNKINVLGLYEVVANGQVFYLSSDYQYVFLGNIIDVKAMKNITMERVNELKRVDFTKLELEKAVKISNGKHSIAVFSDPDCPYCRKYHEELKKLKDVSVYVFLFPLESLHPKAKAKSISAWCSKDRASAVDKIFEGKEIPAKECPNPIMDNIDFAFKNGINGTPATIMPDGAVKSGYMNADQIQAFIKLIESKK